MEHIAAIMMLVGCLQGNVECRELPSSTASFETAEECQELLQPSLNAVSGKQQSVYGKCVPIDPALFIDDATIAWRVTAAGELDVQVKFDDPATEFVAAAKTGRQAVLSN